MGKIACSPLTANEQRARIQTSSPLSPKTMPFLLCQSTLLRKTYLNTTEQIFTRVLQLFLSACKTDCSQLLSLTISANLSKCQWYFNDLEKAQADGFFYTQQMPLFQELCSIFKAERTHWLAMFLVNGKPADVIWGPKGTAAGSKGTKPMCGTKPPWARASGRRRPEDECKGRPVSFWSSESLDTSALPLRLLHSSPWHDYFHEVHPWEVASLEPSG